MTYSVGDIAKLVGGILHGDGSATIHSALPLEEAVAGSVTFVSSKKLYKRLDECKASAVLMTSEFPIPSLPTIVVADPLAAILKVAATLTPPLDRPVPGIDPRAAVDPSAKIGKDVVIGPLAVVGKGAVIGDRTILHPHAVIGEACVVGADVEIHPHAVLYPRTVVADRCIIHSGSVIGCDGFGYKMVDGKHKKVPQLGNVHIGADVEIGANSAVDRATFGTTRIGEGTKIDNLVMVGHNCQIGRHNILVSHVGISGSCTTGDYVVLAGKVGIADHVNIGARTVIAASSGVYTDIPAGQVFLGTPARPEREAKRIHLAIEKLPEMRKQLAEVRDRLGLVNPRFPESEEEARKAAG
ncbi:MAG: UDP-3-O-(3-hydroxymyristoyl)glucosamine N-acyltransferase [Planctomycetota bacterium]